MIVSIVPRFSAIVSSRIISTIASGWWKLAGAVLVPAGCSPVSARLRAIELLFLEPQS